MVGKFNFKLFGINLAIYSIRDIDIHNSNNPPFTSPPLHKGGSGKASLLHKGARVGRPFYTRDTE